MYTSGFRYTVLVATRLFAPHVGMVCTPVELYHGRDLLVAPLKFKVIQSSECSRAVASWRWFRHGLGAPRIRFSCPKRLCDAARLSRESNDGATAWGAIHRGPPRMRRTVRSMPCRNMRTRVSAISGSGKWFRVSTLPGRAISGSECTIDMQRLHRWAVPGSGGPDELQGYSLQCGKILRADGADRFSDVQRLHRWAAPE